MLRPYSLSGDNETLVYYAMVVGIAKRARNIAEQAEQNREILVEKPVSIAVDEHTEGRLKITAIAE